MNERERLIELIDEKQYRGEGKDRFTPFPYGKTRPGTPVSNEELADHLLANGVTVQRWIPVTERLPEEECVVLVYGQRGGIYTAEFRRVGDFGGEYPHWHKLNSKSHHCEPTHWMPLPEPPKGE